MGMTTWLLSLALWHSPAPEYNPQAAAEAAERANVLRQQGRMNDAEAALHLAYLLDPQPKYLFARGVVELEAGKCDHAVELFRQFLATDPPARDAEAARTAMKGCGVSSEPVALPPGPVAPAPSVGASEEHTEPEEPIEPDQPRAKREGAHSWPRDRAGGFLLASGVVIAAIGGGLIGGAHVASNASESAGTTREYRRSLEQARALSWSGIAVLTVGSSLIVGAVVRYVVVARREKRSAATMSLLCYDRCGEAGGMDLGARRHWPRGMLPFGRLPVRGR